jgi:large subunit ribosomal protein L9
MKTEVILLENIVGLGGESDHVKVAAGYARNYLFPQRLAVPLTSANKRQIEALKQRRAEREAHEFNAMSELAKSLSKLSVTIAVKTGEDGKLFGTVTPGMVADELKNKFDVTLDKKKIHLEHPIKTLGEHEIEFRLHPEISTTMKIHVESSTPLPAPTETPAREGREGRRREGEHTEKRGNRRESAETASASSKKGESSEKPARAKTDRGGSKSKKTEKSE